MRSIIKKSEDYVCKLLANTPNDLCFHNIHHTKMVVKATKEVCDKLEVGDDIQEIVTIAAWFHDTGYLKDYSNHEEESKIIAQDFLSKKQYDPGKLEEVLNCINATKFGHKPLSLSEKIICDADVYHLTCKKYFEWLEKLRVEWEKRLNTYLSDKQWYNDNLEFLKKHSFCTDYGKNVLEKRKQKNINKNVEKMEVQFIK
ncbi:HD domain-containing protein [Fulvivirga sediminis]|uniref:HD domain-containing protein n=1 Tax=Fulvivirga sediminis TaxID=2803949 RepID=A0A937F5B6_9BACT|nr:HD domain-containing protein [Fulvivirga sediminis]MBL3654544.1 HD domain-containing protein [Fulvivirga sediminis]